MTAALRKIVEEVERLSEVERRELRALLDRGCADATNPLTEMDLEEKLASEGFLTLPTPPLSTPAALPSPIRTRGRPLSELLLEERR